MKVWDAVWEADSHGPKVLLAAMRAKMEWLLFKLQTISRKSSCLCMMYCSEEATQHGQWYPPTAVFHHLSHVSCVSPLSLMIQWGAISECCLLGWHISLNGFGELLSTSKLFFSLSDVFMSVRILASESLPFPWKLKYRKEWNQSDLSWLRSLFSFSALTLLAGWQERRFFRTVEKENWGWLGSFGKLLFTRRWMMIFMALPVLLMWPEALCIWIVRSCVRACVHSCVHVCVSRHSLTGLSMAFCPVH